MVTIHLHERYKLRDVVEVESSCTYDPQNHVLRAPDIFVLPLALDPQHVHSRI
jgi:hypothetical protein